MKNFCPRRVAARIGAWGLLGLAGAVGGACSGSSSTTKASGPELSEVPRLLATSLCNLVRDCYGPLYPIFVKEDCVTLTTERINQSGFESVEDKVQSGTIVYHPGSVQACLDEYAARDCASLLERYSDTCEQALTGLVELGQLCDIDEECAGDAICATDVSCPGRCVARRSAGEACFNDDDCRDGLSCSPDTSLCVKPAAVNQACGGGNDPPCEPALMCLGEDVDNGVSGTCQPLDDVFSASSGQICSFSDGPLCDPSLSCIIESIPASGNIAGNCGSPVEAGGDCYISVPEMCPSGQYCAITLTQIGAGQSGLCTDLPAAGQPCGTNAAGEFCAPYTRCVDGTCEPLRNLGEVCSDDEQCYSQRCLNGGCVTEDACG